MGAWFAVGLDSKRTAFDFIALRFLPADLYRIGGKVDPSQIDDLIVGGISYQLGIKSDPHPGGGIFYMLNLGTDSLGIPILTSPLPLDVGPDFKPRINSHISLQMFDLDHDGVREMVLSLQDEGWHGRIYSKIHGKRSTFKF